MKMKYITGIVLATLVLWGSAFAVVQQRLGNALITADTLPSDGCQHTATIGQTKYALDTASYALISSAFAKLPYWTNVRQRIWYTITGTTGTVTCGWGSEQTLPQIHIDFFVPKVK